MKTVFRNEYSFFCAQSIFFFGIFWSRPHILKEERGVGIGDEKSDIRILSSNLKKGMGDK